MTEVTKVKNELAKPKDYEMTFIEAADKCNEISTMSNTALKSLRLAAGMQELRSAMNHPEIKSLILSFKDSSLGFMTDEKSRIKSGKRPYSEDQILDCALEALTAGAYMHGNEYNLLAERTYFAQSFFTRKVREYCTSNNIKRDISFDTKWLEKSGKQNKYEVSATIMWQTDASEKPRKQIKKYKLLGQTIDQVEGKAKKRAHQWLYNELTNNNFIAVPDEVFDMPTEQPKDLPDVSFDSNPIALDWLVEKYTEPVVCACLGALEVLKDGETLDAVRSDSKRMDLIQKNREDFDKKIEAFNKI